MITSQFPIRGLSDLASSESVRSFFYLATPYAKYAGGKREAYELACKYTHDLIVAGVPVFSPIAHSHSIAKTCNMNKNSNDLWMPQDLAILRGASELLIAPVAGWRNSKGIAMEVAEANEHNIPIWLLDVHR